MAAPVEAVTDVVVNAPWPTNTSTSLPSPPMYVMVALRSDPRKLGMTAPSGKPLNVPLMGRLVLLFRIVKNWPSTGPRLPLMRRLAPESITAPDVTFSWLKMVGLVSATLKTEPAGSVTAEEESVETELLDKRLPP